MKTIIIGAGELGQNLVDVLLKSGHDVVLIDTNNEVLKSMKGQFDIMTVLGDGASIKVLKRAGIENVNHLLAVSSNDSTNLLACQIAHEFQVETIICRLHGLEFFSEEDGITPEKFGITKIIDAEKDSAERVCNSIDHRYIIERIMFSNPNAVLTAVKICQDSPIIGCPLRLLDERERLNDVRLAGIIRKRELIVPHGDTIVSPGDELYIAGSKTAVQTIIDWIAPRGGDPKRFVIAGATRTGTLIAETLCRQGLSVRVIEPDNALAEALLDREKINLTIIQGSPTDNNILEEAGVGDCDVFISARKDDEDNILCGILAKRIGAKKVVVLTTKSEYIDVVPEIEGINAGFNSCLESINAVLQAIPHLSSEFTCVGAVLERIQAYVHEFRVSKHSPLCNHRIADFHGHFSGEIPIFALVFRGEKVLTPTGSLELCEGDTVAAISTQLSITALNDLFRPKSSVFSK